MTYIVRHATGGDVAAIEALLIASFPEAAEASLVRRLCIDGDMVLTIVADDGDTGALAGMVAFSTMAVDIAGRAVPSVALAPIATGPAHRGYGVADMLIRTGLRNLADAGVVLCFVLGDQAFYGRHGFSADWATGFASPYAGEHFMALPLQGGAMPCGERGEAAHAPAFAALGEAA
ncbi:GNAT family N-acetyltransferase [Sphingomonas sp.]|uniref:GNAT family N-acetyltransferase n=1 Tax=Sphingomonas sp. TaxID=28214 RepID=UPI002DD662FA|nr:N-acetyltransferase [Sphingomonas sp.]